MVVGDVAVAGNKQGAPDVNGRSIGGAASPKWRNAVGSAGRILRLISVGCQSECQVARPVSVGLAGVGWRIV